MGAVFGVEAAIKAYPEETEDHFVGAVFACLGKEDLGINDNSQGDESKVACVKVEAIEAENRPPTAATTLTEENGSSVIGDEEHSKAHVKHRQKKGLYCSWLS